MLSAPSLDGLEIWNGASEQTQGNGLSTVHWDDALQRGRMLPGIATDDCHYAGRDSDLGWTWVFAAARTLSEILAALRAGRSYGSAGPRLLGVELDDAAVEVRCSPARAVRLRSGAWDGCGVTADPLACQWRGRVLARDERGLITAARFEHPEEWPWGRVEVEDEAGRRAWGNPVLDPRAGVAAAPPRTRCMLPGGRGHIRSTSGEVEGSGPMTPRQPALWARCQSRRASWLGGCRALRGAVTRTTVRTRSRTRASLASRSAGGRLRSPR